ncbi:MAG: tRNA (adenosine(37)-N6)-threonylcarbamoyltransferase complex ATPase subunit type 1 TsaE [Bacillota bacterium]|nr:tRNA (adenosine(37)-N6)-threonylcarbamoyltransferase complex ATPase subunit type 1 TsaE [Candidatus Fermentithermobacillaceae bacterium]
MVDDRGTTIRIESRGPDDTRKIGKAIGSRLRGGEVILLKGTLGAGKTTLVQGIARGLGIEGPVQSPSFVLERIHRGRLELRHLDLYRLTGAEALEAGLLSEMGESDVTVIEWAERAEGLIRADLEVRIEKTREDQGRSIIIEARNPALKSLLEVQGTC